MQTAKNNSLDHLNNSFIYLAQIGWEICKPEHYCTGLRDMHLIHIVKQGKGSTGNRALLHFGICQRANATLCGE